MTANVTKSKHSTMYFVTGATEVTRILALRRAATPETTASRIDVSCFDDDYNAYVSGRKDVGEVSLEVIFDITDHQKIIDYANSGAETEFMILAPASETTQAVAPTAVAGEFAAYSTVDNKKFKGYISKLGTMVEDNGVWKANISLQGTGPVTFTPKP